MQIVIDIPDEYRDYIKRNYNFRGKDDYNAAVMAIANGIVLPKGHGRLIDADALKETYKSGNWDLHKVLDHAPTVLEGSNK